MIQNLITSFSTYIKLKLKAINPFRGKLTPNNNKTIENPIIGQQNANILTIVDREIITQSLLNLFIKDILIKIKTETINQYEREAEKQKLIADSAKDKHSVTHAKLLKNTEKLLNNLSIINDALANIEEIQDITKNHVKDKLNFQKIDIVTIKQ